MNRLLKLNQTLSVTKTKIFMNKNLHFSHNLIALSMNKDFVIRSIESMFSKKKILITIKINKYQ
jgi:hypothetical protein